MARRKDEKTKDREVVDADQVIRDYYEGTPESESGSISAEDWRHGREQPTDLLDQPPGTRELFGGDVDAALDRTDIGKVAIGGRYSTPD